MIRFTVPGEPTGKGRPRFIRTTGRTYTPEKTARYENLVKVEFQRQCPDAYYPEGTRLRMRISAHYAVPKSASKKNRAAMLERKIRPTKKPDCDNVLKCIADALNGIAYYDDAQIVHAEISKDYAALPGVEVEIWDIEGSDKDGHQLQDSENRAQTAL